jgi:squalene-associated FAD-dependent desaturase
VVTAHVLGGGVAGLVAALELRDAGFTVQLHEARGWLGGRAFSPDQRVRVGSDFRIDNGPHVMLGCYERTIALCERLGTADAGFVRQNGLAVDYRDPSGEASRLALASWLPAPLAFPPALLTHAGFSFRARCRALLGLGGVLLGAPARWSVATWLGRLAQEGLPDAWIWRPMCRAIMNAEPEHVSARLFLATLRRAFLGSAKRAAIWLPDRSWSELIGEPATAQFPRLGIRVRLRSRVTGLRRDGARVAALALGGSVEAPEKTIEVRPGDIVVSALPWHSLARLVPDHDVVSAAATELAGSPIVSVWFELDPERLDPSFDPAPLTALIGGGPFHFVCRRPSDPPHRFALLNGGGHGLPGTDVERWSEAAKRQLAVCFPECSPEVIDRAPTRVTKENRATIVAGPNTDRFRPRPGALEGFCNLWVCGDWTATGLPSTLEGAADSGYRAVRAVVNDE